MTEGQTHEDRLQARLASIEAGSRRVDLPLRPAPRSGMMGRLLGRSSERTSQERRLDMEASGSVADRMAAVIAHRLLRMDRRDVVRTLPEALFEGALPGDDEDRFMRLADAAAIILRQHLSQTVLRKSDDEIRPILLESAIDAIEEDSSATLSERLRDRLNVMLMQHAQDAEIVKQDALLVEVDNVMLGDVGRDGRMAYAADLIVDGHPLATIASGGDGAIEAIEWFGGHGPEDLEELRDYVAQWGEPREDRHGTRPDSLEELMLDRVTSLLTKYAFIEALKDAVLFCDVQDDAPGGQVIRAMEIDPAVGRETTWEIVMDEYPQAILLDALGEDDAFALWMAFSTT